MSLTMPQVGKGLGAIAGKLNGLDPDRKNIKAQSRTVSGTEEIGQVGAIAANGETEIGRQIAEAMEKVGNEGVITVEEYKGHETDWMSSRACSSTAATEPLFITNADKMRRYSTIRPPDLPQEIMPLKPIVPLLEAGEQRPEGRC